MYNMKNVRIYEFFNLIKINSQDINFVEKYAKFRKKMAIFQVSAKR